jgi:hypothetical protein
MKASPFRQAIKDLNILKEIFFKHSSNASSQLD